MSVAVGATASSPASHRRSGASWILLGCAAAGGFGALVADWSPSTAGLLIAAIGLVLGVPLLVNLALGRFDPFEPLFGFALAYGAMFVVRPAASLAGGEFEYPLKAGSADFSRGFEPMLVLALLGAIGFVAGYLAPAGKAIAHRVRGPLRSYDPGVASIVALGFAVVGFTFFLLFLLLAGGFDALAVYASGRSVQLTQLETGSNKYLVFGPVILVPAAVILLALGTRHRNAAVIAAGVLAVVAIVMVAAPTGRRSLLFPVFLSLGLYAYLTQGRRPSGRALLAVLALLLTLSAFVGSVRNAETRRTAGVSGAARQLVHNPSLVFAPLTNGADAALAPGLAALLSLPPGHLAIDSNGMAVVGDLLARPIPRALWSAKPEPPRQAAARQLFGRQSDVFFANPEFSVVLYPYLDAGVLGVLAFMVLYGIAARALYEYTLRHAWSIAVRVSFALLMPVLVAGVRDSPVDTVARLAFMAVPIALTFGLASALRAPARSP